MQTQRFMEAARLTLRETERHLDKDAPAELRARLAELERTLDVPRWVTSQEAADLLGVSSPTTVKNWLEGGHFPSARRTPGGHWRFLLSDVLAVKDTMEHTRRANASGDVAVPDLGDEEVDVPRF